MSSKKRGFAFLLASLALFAASPVFGATITVTNTNDSGSGSLRAAIAAAAPGDTINFNLAYPATITLSSFLTIRTNLTIAGPGASNLAISGNNAVGIFEITAGTVTISGLTIENGYGEGGAGPIGDGIYNTATVTVINSTLSGNSGGFSGGGIFNSGTMTVINSTLSNNHGAYGGGIVNEGAASVTGSTISGNFGLACGGAIYNNGTIAISNSTVSGNGTNAEAGGICNDGGTLTITNSTVSKNGSVEGGGIESGSIGSEISSNYPGSPMATITNSTISGNHADIGGGGITAGGSLTITNSTISGNYAGFAGGGINGSAGLTITNSTIVGNSSFYPGSGAGIEVSGITIKNTILAGNFNINQPGASIPANCSSTGTATSDGHNLSDDNSCLDFFTGPGDLNNTLSGVDPGGLKNNGGPTQTIALVSGPGIHAIPLAPVNYCTLTDGATPVATDQRGVPRPQSPKGCSIGAFEPESASAYSLLQALYTTLEAQIKALPHPDSDKHDGDHDRDRDHEQAKDVRQQLTEAAGEISETLDAKDWAGTDGNHLVRDRVFRFFVDDRTAAEDLSRILHDHDHDRDDDIVIPSQSIQNDLQSLVSANRKLAVTAIADATGRNPELLARANAKLADGDRDAAGGHYERAIDSYEKAWSLAENAL
jgi:hypothetical protein